MEAENYILWISTENKILLHNSNMIIFTSNVKALSD